ncbi:30414_t:CDS:2 [Gigaspora margarita]|uniref:30414_t:CDS:1 n=1 Tax=Gigaspora margarita TaxID=4874 RepID=A0ABN7V0P0_GIGMA|nr:30414_t:CDS:2 [Gigaspora margarita]
MYKLISLTYLLIIFNNNFVLTDFIPTSRWGANAIYFNNKIYYGGGYLPLYPDNWRGTQPSNEFFSLDVPPSFNLTDRSKFVWTNLSSQSTNLIPFAFSSQCLIEDKIMMFGGDFDKYLPPANTPLVWFYDLSSSSPSWVLTKTTGQPNDLESGSLVYNNNTGNIYMWAGKLSNKNTLLTGGASPEDLPTTMNIFNKDTNVWTSLNLTNAPEGRYDFTSTLLRSGIIVYIGGQLTDANGFADMSQTTGGSYVPSTRARHTAVLTKDDRIIVYGGHTGTDKPLSDALAILNVSQIPFVWTQPNVVTFAPSPRTFHTSVLIGDFMIVAFGKSGKYIASGSDDLDILDVSDPSEYSWVNSIMPKPNKTNKISTTVTVKSGTTSNYNFVNFNLSIMVILLVIIQNYL